MKELFILVLGAMLTGVGVILKSHRERKSSLCVALFLYLEIRRMAFLVNEFRFDRVWGLMLQKMTKIGAGNLSKEQSEMFETLFRQLLSETLSSQLSIGAESVSGDFRNIISEIARTDPMLAYQLNGRQNLWEFVELMRQYQTTVISNVPEEERPAVPALNRFFEQTTSEIISEVEDDIFSIASRIGVLTWLRCKWRLRKKSDNQFEKDFMDGMDVMLKKFVRELPKDSKS